MIVHRACHSPVHLPQRPVAPVDGEPHDRYHVILNDTQVPILERFSQMARAMDADGDGIVSSDEILSPDTDLAPIQIDQPDFTFGLKHALTGLASPYAQAYPSAAQIEAKLEQLEAAYPDLAHREQIGTTEEGRPLWALRVGRGPTGEKPGVLVVGGQHAREWAPNQAVTEAAERLLKGYESDPEMARRVNNLELWFVPMSNPDGYEFSRNANPDWRKNRGTVNGEKVGVDLNRNYSADFRFYGDAPDTSSDDLGASDDPFNLTFRGPHAVSEEESRALTDFMETHSNLAGALDVHAFGRLILFPGVKSEERQQMYRDIATRIQGKLDVPYTPLAIPDLYPTTGDITAFGEAKGMLSMGLELGTAFQPSPDKVPAVRDQGATAILSFLDEVLTQQQGQG